MCAIGIACGTQTCGHISKKHVEVGLSCIAGLGIVAVLIALYSFRSSLVAVVINLFLLGFVSGFFIIPFDSFVQTFSKIHHRGQVIAANNFLSFCGVLLAPITLYLISGFFDLSAAIGFLVMAFATLGFTCFLWLKATSHILNFISRRFFKTRKPKSNTASTKKELIAHWATTPFSIVYIKTKHLTLKHYLLNLTNAFHCANKPPTIKDHIKLIQWTN